MAASSLDALVRGLRRLAGSSAASGLPDAQLLERFVAEHDEAAFEVLLWRHGPMVLGVCRRLLRQAHDVEDAFQATFLALVQKAASLRKREAVASWLYKIAYRVALRLQAGGAKQAAQQQRDVEGLAGADRDELTWQDLRPVLDEEVSRLPARYRVPFILCHVEGRTHAQAARELGCPAGTVSYRLAWARQRLRTRLARRGVTLSAGLLTAAFFQKAASAVPPGLAGSTVKAAMLYAGGAAAAGGISATAAALSAGVLRAMLMTKLKTAAALVLALSLVGVGIYTGTHRLSAADQEESRSDRPTKAAAAAADPRPSPDIPSAAELIASVNRNARLIHSIECGQVDLDCSQRLQSMGLEGKLVCQKPQNFRMSAKIGGRTMVDMGSNEQEFWFWISKADPPYLYHCSHKELSGGKVHLPLPAATLQPAWIAYILGLAEYDPAKEYQVVPHEKTVELVEKPLAWQGQWVRRVTVFPRSAKQKMPTGYLLRDARGQELWKVVVSKFHRDAATGALLPRRLKMVWPTEHLAVKVSLHAVTVNSPLDKERKARLFTRPVWYNSASFDLAARRIDKGSRPICAANLDAGIQVEVGPEQVELRFGEQAVKVCGKPDSEMALKVLHDRIGKWARSHGRPVMRLRVICQPGVPYAAVQGILDACQEAGVSRTEISIVEGKAGK